MKRPSKDILCWGSIAVVTALLILSRKFFIGDVESDYLGTFVPEAKRFLAGAALELKFHLPLYSITIGLINAGVQNWWITGLILTWASSIAAVLMFFQFFKRLSGTWAAYGAMFGLISSPAFLIHAASASSDVFFLAVQSAALWFALLAMFNPLKSPIAIQFFSHKFLRVVIPFLMMLIFMINIFLLKEGLYNLIFVIQALFYIMALMGVLARHQKYGILGFMAKACYIPYVFCLLNFSALVGFFKFIFSKQEVTWMKARAKPV